MIVVSGELEYFVKSMTKQQQYEKFMNFLTNNISEKETETTISILEQAIPNAPKQIVISFFLALMKQGLSMLLNSPKISLIAQKCVSESIKLNDLVLGDSILKAIDSSQYLVSILPVDLLLDDTIGETSILFKLIKFGDSEVIWKCIHKILPKNEDPDILKSRLDVLIAKDHNGLNLVDYAIMRKKGVVAEYVQKFIQKINGPAIEFPTIMNVTLYKHIKNKEELDIEDKIKNTTIKLCNLFGGDIKTGAKIKLDRPKIIGAIGSDLEFYLHRYQSKDKDKILELDQQIRYRFSGKDSFFKLFELDFPYMVVDSEHLLEQCASELRNETLLCFDVELAHAIPDSSLPKDESYDVACASIQICSPVKSYFIDTLLLDKYIKKYLKSILEDPNTIKVFHSCEGDIKYIYQSYGILVRNIFDTSKAEKILSDYNTTPGLRQLSKKILNVEIDKSYQFSTWSMRPLPSPMIEYAIADAVLLLPIFDYYANVIRQRLTTDWGVEGKIWVRSNLLDRWAKNKDFITVAKLTSE